MWHKGSFCNNAIILFSTSVGLMLKPERQVVFSCVTSFIATADAWGQAATTMNGNADAETRLTADVDTDALAFGMAAIVNNFCNMSSPCRRL